MSAMGKKGKGKKKSKKDSEPTEPPHDPGWERVSPTYSNTNTHTKKTANVCLCPAGEVWSNPREREREREMNCDRAG